MSLNQVTLTLLINDNILVPFFKLLLLFLEPLLELQILLQLFFYSLFFLFFLSADSLLFLPKYFLPFLSFFLVNLQASFPAFSLISQAEYFLSPLLTIPAQIDKAHFKPEQ